MGPNGAGKTTAINIMSGHLSPSAGTVTMGGVDLTGRSPAHIARLGLSRTFQLVKIFPDLSVLENVMMGGYMRQTYGLAGALLRPRVIRKHERALTVEAEAVCDQLGLHHLDGPCGELSLGLRRVVEVARALLGQPRVLVLDEPAAGLNADEAASFASTLLSIRERYDLTVVIVEHNVTLVRRVADSMTVMSSGKLIVSGDVGTVMDDPRVQSAYLGVSATDAPSTVVSDRE